MLEYGDEIVVLGGARAPALLDGLLPLLDGTRTTAGRGRGARREPGRRRRGRARAARARAASCPGRARARRRFSARRSARHEHPQELEDALRGAAVAVVRRVGLRLGARPPARAAGRRVRRGRLGGDAPDADMAVVAPAPAELPRVGVVERAGPRAAPALAAGPAVQRPLRGARPAVRPRRDLLPALLPGAPRARRSASPSSSPRSTRLRAGYPEPRALATALAGARRDRCSARWLATPRAVAAGRCCSRSSSRDGLRVDGHRVLRVPRCPACSPATRTCAAPLPWSAA